MAGPECCERITNLAVTEVTGRAGQLWTRLLQAIGPSLENLQLVCARGRGCRSVDESALSLASNPNLRRLEIQIEPDYNDFTDMLSPEELDAGFPRTSGWWPIFNTVPRVTQADIEVKFTRTVWDAFARSYSKPVSKIIHSSSHSPLKDIVRVGRATSAVRKGGRSVSSRVTRSSARRAAERQRQMLDAPQLSVDTFDRLPTLPTGFLFEL